MKSASRLRNAYLVATLAGSLAMLGASEVRVGQNAQGELLYRLERKPILTEKAKKELQSGLATQVLILAKLESAEGRIEWEQAKRVSIRYDLWDEKYWMETLPEKTKTSFPRLSDIESWIEGPGPFSWMRVSELKPGTAYKLEVIETLNPVTQDRLEELQKWLIQQRLTRRVGRSDRTFGEISLNNETPFTSLFYSLWKKAITGELAGEIQRRSFSGSFTPSSVPKGGLP